MEVFDFTKKMVPGLPLNLKTVVVAVIIAAIFVALAFGFYKVEPGEQGVIRRFGRYNRVVGEGRIPGWR